MKRHLSRFAIASLHLSGCTSPGDALWQHVAGSVDDERSGHVAAGTSGDVVLVSDSVMQTTSFFPVAGHPGVAGGTLHFVRYEGATGTLVAAASVGSGAIVRDIVTDPMGNTYVVGRVATSNDFGAGPGPGRGMYILKFDPTGAVLWSQQFAGDLSGGPEDFRHIAYDESSDSVLVGGVYSSEDFDVDLGLGPLIPEIDGFFVARFDSAGATLDVSTGFSEIGPIAVSPSGDFAMTGFYGVEDTLVMGGIVFNAPSTIGNFFAVLAPDLTPVSVEMSENGGFATRYAVAAASDGTYWATSEVGDVPGGPTSGNTNYLAHYDAAGTYIDHRELLGNANPQGLALRSDAPVIVGNFTVGADLGTGPLTPPQGMFTVQYDTNIDVEWINVGTTSTGHLLNLADVAVLPTGDVAVAGQNSGDAEIDVGLGPIPGYASSLDTFVSVIAG